MRLALPLCALLTASTNADSAVWRDPEAPSSFDAAPAQFQLYKLAPDNAYGAFALDGSPAAFYFHEGTSDNWAFYFQGGGWLVWEGSNPAQQGQLLYGARASASTSRTRNKANCFTRARASASHL